MCENVCENKCFILKTCVKICIGEKVYINAYNIV